MNEYLSYKLKVISLLLMVMVVFLHSYNIIVSFNSGNININSGVNFFIQEFISHGVTRIAVPSFFFISGYLFFLNFNGKIQSFLNKFKSRIKSLLVPYLLWSAWGLIFFFLLQSFPQSKNFFANELIIDYTFGEILNTLFLNPLPYQLWFIRDLVMLVVFSPIIYWLINKFKIAPLILFFILWIGVFHFNVFIFTYESLFFYSLGSYFSIFKSDLLLVKRTQNRFFILFFLWITILIIKTIIAYNDYNTVLLLILLKISILIGIVVLWSLYDVLMKNKLKPNSYILFVSSFSFLIYAFHEPILIMMKKGVFYVLGISNSIALVNYFLSPIITIIISVILGYVLKNQTPSFYKLITGGR
ncbi:acyltransferase family protein [Cyclobacterium marinum]|uniref:acyltransferase family protein n=1 Tax=Cyclobacterium marinum TaxID=104 RepID=UPI0011EF0230|nr:acyltransferase [Cyclobacterium marinum]MBI0400169.1 acyltransferase [Cyclobacterium marinum]